MRLSSKTGVLRGPGGPWLSLNTSSMAVLQRRVPSVERKSRRVSRPFSLSRMATLPLETTGEENPSPRSACQSGLGVVGREERADSRMASPVLSGPRQRGQSPAVAEMAMGSWQRCSASASPSAEGRADESASGRSGVRVDVRFLGSVRWECTRKRLPVWRDDSIGKPWENSWQGG